MRKKLSLLALLVLVAASPVYAQDYDFSAVTSSGHTLYYNIVSGGVEVTYPCLYYNNYQNYYWHNTTQPTGALVIDSTVTYGGTTYTVTSIRNCAFIRCTGITSVTIPNSVTSIGGHAFYSCTGLTSVTIPNTNISIGDDVFTGCRGITTPLFSNTCFAYLPTSYSGNYSIPDGIITICGGALSGCSELLSVSVPNSVVDIRDDAFKNCTKLASITFPDGVTSIGYSAFSGCLRLTSVRLGEGVINIGDHAFKDCGIIGELVIPQSVTTIGYEGFRNCYGVNEITCLGRVAPSLGSDAFLGLDTSITVNIPCGTTNLYAGRWSYFHNFNEIPFLFKVASDNPAQGTVQMVQEPSCDDPVAIVRATARSGYHFDHWSDGSTQNPYTCVVTGSMTLTAFFASDSGPIGIEDADGETSAACVYTNGTQIIVEGADSLPVYLYDAAGRLLSTQPSGQSPCHLTAPSAGNYLVKIGDLPARKIVIVR